MGVAPGQTTGWNRWWIVVGRPFVRLYPWCYETSKSVKTRVKVNYPDVPEVWPPAQRDAPGAVGYPSPLVDARLIWLKHDDRG